MRTDPSHKHGTPGLIRQIGSVPLQAFWATQSKPFSPSTGTQSIPAARRVATRSELHKSVPLSRFMKLRGCLRADQPISGRFSRHYYSIGVPPLQLQNSYNFPRPQAKISAPGIYFSQFLRYHKRQMCPLILTNFKEISILL